MRGSGSRVIAAGIVCAALLAGGGTADAAVRAGAAAVDATWHVGASAGQYASDGTPLGEGGVDPGLHSTRRAPSYGVQSRLSARAIVVEGSDGKRWAIVKQDLYIPQDLLWRRTAQILAAGDSGIDESNLTMAATHDHSSPYYSSPSWGVWAFQDVFDLRFYDYYAHRLADAVEQASKHMEPVRVSAARTTFEGTARNSMGPSVADDGTPSGYPYADSDTDMSVVRFDSVKTRGSVATLVNYNLHGEGNEGNDLISADWVAPLQRMVDRATGGVTVWTQNAVGTAEPEKSLAHSIHDRLEFSHRDYAQNERGARLMSDAIVRTWRKAGAGQGVSLGTDFPVAVADKWFPGPLSHPFPTVSNCRTDQALNGNPQAPIVGLPDCTGPGESAWDDIGVNPGISTDDFERAGVPIPENYGAVGYTGLEEDLGVHLQAVRLGDVLLTICSCEQWADQARNIKTRTDVAQGNEYLGYDWSRQCTPSGADWICPDPRDTSRKLPPISDLLYRRMKAQVENDAAGWNDPSYVPWAESEPADPALIKGNYTHSELPPAQGYKMTVTVSMANDYNGYIATYREYQRGDHYRKALTAWGPHSSDYMATRLVEMGGALHGGAAVPDEPLSAKNVADQAHQDARASALGTLADKYIPLYEATLPDDGDTAHVNKQPSDLTRFDATRFIWTGGSNYTDNPDVVVQRRVDGDWVPYADQSGELPVTVEYPKPADIPSYELGGQKWRWTAWFEAFGSEVSSLTTPVGEYRFVVHGKRRKGGKVVQYSLTSAVFEVKPWNGITVPSIATDGSFTVGPTTTLHLPRLFGGGHSVESRVGADGGSGELTAAIGPIDYPDSYKVHPRFIKQVRTAIRDGADLNDPSRFEWYCFQCSFRPWADTGAPSCADVTIVDDRGRASRVPARLGADGRWRPPVRPRAGSVALVQPGGIRDAFGQVNARASAVAGNGTRAAERAAAKLAKRMVSCR